MKKITKRLSIILADDDSDDRNVFHDAIKSIVDQFDFQTFEDGEEVVAHFKKPNVVAPDILFLDINMPNLGGLDVLSILRNKLKLLNLPIAIYSTSSRDADVQSALIKGANVYIKKPTNFSELQQSLQKVLQMNLQFTPSSMETFVLYV